MSVACAPYSPPCIRYHVPMCWYSCGFDCYSNPVGRCAHRSMYSFLSIRDDLYSSGWLRFTGDPYPLLCCLPLPFTLVRGMRSYILAPGRPVGSCTSTLLMRLMLMRFACLIGFLAFRAGWEIGLLSHAEVHQNVTEFLGCRFMILSVLKEVSVP